MIAQDFELEQTGGLVVARIAAPQFSAEQMQELTAELTQAIRYNNAAHFVLDLSKTEYIDSSCLGVLVSFLQEVEHVRGRVALAACRPNVAFVFRVTRLNAVFMLYDEVEEAKTAVVRG